MTTTNFIYACSQFSGRDFYFPYLFEISLSKNNDELPIASGQKCKKTHSDSNFSMQARRKKDICTSEKTQMKATFIAETKSMKRDN